MILNCTAQSYFLKTFQFGGSKKELGSLFMCETVPFILPWILEVGRPSLF